MSKMLHFKINKFICEIYDFSQYVGGGRRHAFFRNTLEMLDNSSFGWLKLIKDTKYLV